MCFAMYPTGIMRRLTDQHSAAPTHTRKSTALGAHVARVGVGCSAELGGIGATFRDGCLWCQAFDFSVAELERLRPGGRRLPALYGTLRMPITDERPRSLARADVSYVAQKVVSDKRTKV